LDHCSEDITLNSNGVRGSDDIDEGFCGIFVKFRIVEEGPKAVMTIPYDSRSASPVYEIMPEKQKRSIIAYGRIPINLQEAESFRRVELYEVASDEKCGQLAVGVHLTFNESKVDDVEPSATIVQPAYLTTSAAIGITRIGSASTVSERTNEANVVLDELHGEQIPVTEAEVISPSSGSSSDEKSTKPLYSGSFAEETDMDDENALTEQMESSPSEASNSTCDTFSDILGLLSLEIVAAQKLPKERRMLRSSAYAANPFVTISFGKRSFRTKMQRNTCNPVWKEKLAFSVRMTEMNYQAMFSVYDYENFGYNSCLATANIRIGHFIQNPEQVLKLAIPLNISLKPQSKPHAQEDGSETVVHEEACLLVKGSFLPYEKVRKNFWTKLLRAFDLNQSGSLCKLEFETMLESLGSTLSESTIEKIFAGVGDEEIEIDEAVRVLEDLTVHSPNSVASATISDDQEEKIVILKQCPFCMKHWGTRSRQDEIDVITHLGICSASESSQMDKFVMGGFLTEEYASRKWFARLLSFMSFGNYRLGRNNGNILVQDRRTGKLLEEKMPTYIRLGIRMLHQNVVTYRTAVDFGYVRNIFQSLTIQQGKKFDHPSSVANIPGFIKYHKLPVHEISDPLSSFRCFNDFFYRHIRLDEYRPLASPGDESVAVSPADCRLNVFSSVEEATRLWIKGVNFNLKSLLRDDGLAEYFDGGSLVIARLAPQDYHRFHSPVQGTITLNYHIPGTYYTVNPMAVRQKVDVYTENARTVTVIDSPQFGRVAFVSVGAMMVGSIRLSQEVGDEVERMSEIGYFAFGGSTIVLLFAKGAKVEFDQDLLDNSREQLETLVKVGESIGRSNSKK
jgi:phosphatidylserine decarboxylase